MNVLTFLTLDLLMYSVCNCNCKHYRTKFYFGFQYLNKVIIIIMWKPMTIWFGPRLRKLPRRRISVLILESMNLPGPRYSSCTATNTTTETIQASVKQFIRKSWPIFCGRFNFSSSSIYHASISRDTVFPMQLGPRLQFQ